MNMNKLNSSPALNEEQERGRIRKAALIKMLAMGVFVVVVMVFGSIAWFTSNKENSVSGMVVKVQGLNFEITSIVEKDSDGQWYDPYHTKIRSGSVSNALVWQMTDESNFANFENNNSEEQVVGIKPGSYGMVSFNVIPRDVPLDLEFDFNVIGYHSSDSVFNENPTSGIDNLTMTPVAELENGEELTAYLKGHILLFENRTPVYDTKTIVDPETGEETIEQIVVSYTYSGLLASNEDLTRVLKNSSKTHFTSSDTATRVDIYWIWPNTLSTLVDVSSGGNTSVTPICSGDDLDEVQNYVVAHPEWFLRGYVVGDEEGGDAQGETAASSLTLQDIINNYEVYGDMYDMADNSIGMNVSYVLLELSAVQDNSGASIEGDGVGVSPEAP